MSERWREGSGSAMASGNGEDGSFEAKLDRALGAAPAVQIPADFASRVAAVVEEPRPRFTAPSHYGRWALLVCGMVLVVAMFVLAVRMPQGSRASMAMEMLLGAELIVVALGAGSWRRVVRWRI